MQPLKNERCMILGPNLTKSYLWKEQRERESTFVALPPIVEERGYMCVHVYFCVVCALQEFLCDFGGR